MIASGKSPAREKARDKGRVKNAETFGVWAEKWLRGYQMADSTRDMRKSVYTRELKTRFGNQKLVGITHEDLRALTDAIVGGVWYMDRVGTSPQYRAAAKLLLLTMVRKPELSNATWSEINFSEALWTIPKERMKWRNSHLVFLSRQTLDLFTALKTVACGSAFVLPTRYDSDLPMSSATLNRVLALAYKAAHKNGEQLDKFGPHDLRRTASTTA